MVLIPVRDRVDPQSHSEAGRVKPMKNSRHTIGNQTRDLPVCSAVPQLTACSVSCRPSFRHVHKIVKSDC